MACTHKFYGHNAHLPGENGLLPKWKAKTLIIGTFNPEQLWHLNNSAEYYYGRTRNYFWTVLPRFAGLDPIPHGNVNAQLAFLESNQIAVTDLLISIDDADLDNQEHVARIKTVLDNKIELFRQFTWNTDPILNYIAKQQIETVYFTKLGKAGSVNPRINTFEAQIRKIENYCINKKIPTYRLHTPSGQGLGAGSPRAHKLIHKWYDDNGAKQFPFLSTRFDILDFPFQK